MAIDFNNLVVDSSIFTQDQFPAFYVDNQSAFIDFVRFYYQWMGSPGNQDDWAKTVLANRDIDTTLPQFLDHFKQKFAPGTSFQTLSDLDTRLFIKSVSKILAEKGAFGAIKFILRAQFGVDSSVYIPNIDVMRPSAAQWNEVNYMELSYSAGTSTLVGNFVRGAQSGATAYVSGYREEVISGRVICVLTITNIVGTFVVGDPIVSKGITQTPIPYIIGSMSGITIYQGGINFQIGNEVDVSHAPSDYGSVGLAVVSSVVPVNGVVNFAIQSGGAGYANSVTDPENFMGQSIILTQDPTNPGAGATFDVGTLSNTTVITTSNDFIQPYASVPLDSPGYGFPAQPSANLSSPIDLALTIRSIEVGTINDLSFVNPGSGYNGAVTVAIQSNVMMGFVIYDSNNNLEGDDAVIVGQAGRGEGAISSVVVRDSGFGYVTGEHVALSSNDNPGEFANGIVTVGAVGTARGFWSDSNSFLDYPKYIQDSDYYQQFSYQVNSPVDPSVYNSVISPFHVAGTKRFSAVYLESEVHSAVTGTVQTS